MLSVECFFLLFKARANPSSSDMSVVNRDREVGDGGIKSAWQRAGQSTVPLTSQLNFIISGMVQWCPTCLKLQLGCIEKITAVLST